MVWPGKTRWQLGPSWKKVESRINGVNLPDGKRRHLIFAICLIPHDKMPIL